MPLPCMAIRLDARPRFVKSQYISRGTGGNPLDEAAPCALDVEYQHVLDVEYQHVVHPPLRHDAGGLLPRAEWGRTKL